MNHCLFLSVLCCSGLTSCTSEAAAPKAHAAAPAKPPREELVNYDQEFDKLVSQPSAAAEKKPR